MTRSRLLAAVTGASSGIGAATARRLAHDGWDVVVGARRLDRLQRVADEIGARAVALDVTDQSSVDGFAAAVGPRLHLLVNNAGGALGLDPVASASVERWQQMYDTNVLGTLRVTRALLDALEGSGGGTIVNVTSIAAYEAYAGGAGYNAAKFAQRAMTEVLRDELLGRPVRVCEIAPGMVDTEFSLVRFDGDAERAAAVYEGMDPLTADDVADSVAWVASRPSRVNIDHLRIMARDQLGTRRVARR